MIDRRFGDCASCGLYRFCKVYRPMDGARVERMGGEDVGGI